MVANPRVIGFQPILSAALKTSHTQSPQSVWHVLDTAHPSIDKDFKTMYAKSSNSAGFYIAGYDFLRVLSPIFGL
jgi:hypothetical protein